MIYLATRYRLDFVLAAVLLVDLEWVKQDSPPELQASRG
jgi:hypothetical protein